MILARIWHVKSVKSDIKNRMNMKRTLTMAVSITLMLIASIGCSAQNTKIVASKKYVSKTVSNPAEFHTISLVGSPDVDYTVNVTGKTTLEIYGADNVLPYVETDIRDGVLTVAIKPNTNIQGNAKLRVIASSPSLRKATVTGSGDISINGVVSTKEFTVSIAGSGDIVQHGTIECDKATVGLAGSGDIELDYIKCDGLACSVAGSGDIEIANAICTAAEVRVAGSGDISIKGQADGAEMSVAGSGDLNAKGFVVTALTASVAGSGSISCFADDSIKATVKGSGSITYYGHPRVKSKHGQWRRIHER
jgi:hypothetical protein